MASATKTVTAANGRRLLLRSVESGDKELIARGLECLSERSRYRRFLTGKAEFTAAELAYLTEIDHHDHEAVVAIDPASGDAIGVARYVRLTSDPETAEPAVAVGDAWQSLGVGTALLRALVARARAEGILRFRATVLRENAPAFKLIERNGGLNARRWKGAGPQVEVELLLTASPRRDRTAAAHRRWSRAARRGASPRTGPRRRRARTGASR
jgi:RimJ/RimL family protein N-acetyltransferase